MASQMSAGAGSTRGPWIIAGAILLAAILVVGTLLYFRAQDQRCAEWQAEVRNIAEITGLPTGSAASALEDEQPARCAAP